MTTRIRQRITLGNEVQWVTARTQQELIDSIIHLTLKHAEGCSSGGRKTHDFQSYATNWMKLYKENCLKHTTLREYAPSSRNTSSLPLAILISAPSPLMMFSAS